jgi:CRP-like cAMP-binding protein
VALRRGFSDREITQLAERMSLVGVTAGRQIIRQGQEPTFIGLMVQGSASVVNLEGDVVAALGPGGALHVGIKLTHNP